MTDNLRATCVLRPCIETLRSRINRALVACCSIVEYRIRRWLGMDYWGPAWWARYFSPATHYRPSRHAHVRAGGLWYKLGHRFRSRYRWGRPDHVGYVAIGGYWYILKGRGRNQPFLPTRRQRLREKWQREQRTAAFLAESRKAGPPEVDG